MPPVEPQFSTPDEEPSAEPEAPRRAAEPQRRRRWPWVVGAIALVLVALVGLGAWLGTRVLTVRDELTAAQGSLDELRDGDMKQALATLAEHGERATEAAHDPVWGAAEHLPWAGENLRAARLAAETLDALAGGLGVPALQALQAKTDEPMLARVLPVLQEAAPGVHELTVELQQIRRSGNLVSQLRGPIDQVADVMAAVDPVLQVVPGMLGAEGERNYLLVAQTNAELLPLGGSAASQSLIRFSEGTMKIVKQADSQQYQRRVPVDVDIDQSAIDLYDDYLVKEINASVGRPDWPTAAKTIIAFWNRDIDPEPVDGAISMDPLALARLMRATGPVTVDGHEINADNAVSFLLSEAYALYSPSEADAIFKATAMAVMESLVGGGFEPAELWSAISESIDAGSLMFWSADPEVQAMIAPWRLSGILPTSNQPNTIIGVFFRDFSQGAKIDYHLRTEADVTSSCEADGSVTYTVLVTLWLDLTKEQLRKLPNYVVGGDPEAKTFHTVVFLAGPPGTEVTEEFRDRDSGKATQWRPLDLHDLGRPTPSFETINPVGGETVTVGVTFTGPPGEYGPVEVRATPMVNPLKVTLTDTCTG